MFIYLNYIRSFSIFLTFPMCTKTDTLQRDRKLSSVKEFNVLMQVLFEKHHIALPNEGILRGGKIVSAFIADC